MNYTVSSRSFDYNWSILSLDVVNACVRAFLMNPVMITAEGLLRSNLCSMAEGVYVVLFILAVYTLARRQSAGKKLLLGYTWTMAVFGTVQLVLCLVQASINARFVEVLVKQDVAGNLTSEPELARLVLLDRSLNTAQQIIFAGNNLVTDSLLVYRCFVIWGSDWRPVIFPGVLMVCTFVTGCVNSVMLVVPASLVHLPYIFAALTNLVLVALIGGRIWWIRQDARVIARNEMWKRYGTVIAMILESGAVYCVVSVLLAILANDFSGIAFNILQSIARHTVNIVPTLIIVRVGLGQNIQDIGKTHPAEEARNTPPQPRPDFSAHRTRPESHFSLATPSAQVNQPWEYSSARLVATEFVNDSFLGTASPPTSTKNVHALRPNNAVSDNLIDCGIPLPDAAQSSEMGYPVLSAALLGVAAAESIITNLILCLSNRWGPRQC
ncbi:hypothetical protein B0H16DRAFT_1694880 [Mycena metata]|uniref:Uncharacterized protein n=1 Tax=Mycena metata TaxID=1033252 RepID=A0AAD7IBQ7_9AGAR|nr:hypothetical protein B0H16DRAFT_1694880 [Mycena metata]